MRKFSYWLCFVLVAIPSFVGLASWLLSLADRPLPGQELFSVLFYFASPVPAMFAPLLPPIAGFAVTLFMFALAVRRIWLVAARKQGVPTSFAGLPKFLGYIGTTSVLLAAIVLILSVVLRAGSGVPAGLLLIPAAFCVPWAILLTEVMSFRGGERGEV